jgi:hypothetical protein
VNVFHSHTEENPMATATKKMTQKQALAEATRRWGKGAGVRYEPKRQGTAASRLAAEAELRALMAVKPVEPIGVKREVASPEWAAFRAARNEWMKAKDEAWGRSVSYKYTVGCVVMGLFFEIKGQGDSWEEAFKAVRF